LRIKTAIRDADGVLLSVEDSGTGIAPPHIRVVLHDEIARHRNGADDLSVDYRSPSRSALGFIRR
jgi:hypothetical protein